MTWATKGHVGVTARNNRRFAEAAFYRYTAIGPASHGEIYHND